MNVYWLAHHKKEITQFKNNKSILHKQDDRKFVTYFIYFLFYY